jgi:AAA domain
MPPSGRRGVPQRNKRRTTARQEENDPTLINADTVTIEIEDMASFHETKNICLYGPSGVGKTVLAGGTPNGLFLTTEKGLASALRSGSEARIMRAYDWEHILAGLRKADEVLGEKDWLIVDSGTKMQVLYMRWILRMANRANSSRSLDIPALHDHQQYQNGFKRFIDHVLDAKYNSICVFGEMEIPGEDDEMEKVPHIEGGKTYQVCRYIIGQFDVGIRYSISSSLSKPGDTVRLALTQPTANHWAKDRYMALGDWQTVGANEFTAMADFIWMIEHPDEEFPDA